MNLINRDLEFVWHPCSQMKDYETNPPIIINKAQGDYLYLDNGDKLIDAISSWWCKSLGHGHPRLREALIKQAQKFEHVILADTTNEIIVSLSERLAQLTQGQLNKAFYAGDGSCAVEAALKMSLQAHQLSGETQRTQFMSFANGYHGETLLTLAVSDNDEYSHHTRAILPYVEKINHLPYVANRKDDLWNNCATHWQSIVKQLEPHADTLSAIIFEPILQGAGNMRIYSADLLRRLRVWTKAHNIHLIADEIMTGFGRTGKALACDHADITPDFICLSKGLTSGWLPMSVVLTSTAIYEHFYGDYELGKTFKHSHTYSGNPLAAAVAHETLNIFKEEGIYQQVEEKEFWMLDLLQDVADATGKLENVRGIGAMVAADLICDPNQRMGYAVYQNAKKHGALLRPLGNTIYWLPPLNCQKETLLRLRDITEVAIKETFE